MTRLTWPSIGFGRNLTRRTRALTATIVVVLSVVLAWSAVSVAMYGPSLVYLVPTNSMAPTIRSGDRVGVQTTSSPTPRRGEIWVFHLPSPGSRPVSIAVKRVIGLPGESIEVRDGKVWIDGRGIEEPYLSAAITYTLPPVALGADEFFMMGDSRDSSHDSHVWGPLPRDHLVGPVTVRVWPLSRAGGLLPKSR